MFGRTGAKHCSPTFGEKIPGAHLFLDILREHLCSATTKHTHTVQLCTANPCVFQLRPNSQASPSGWLRFRWGDHTCVVHLGGWVFAYLVTMRGWNDRQGFHHLQDSMCVAYRQRPQMKTSLDLHCFYRKNWSAGEQVCGGCCVAQNALRAISSARAQLAHGPLPIHSPDACRYL